MKKLNKIAFVVISVFMIMSLSACLDPVSLIPDINFNITGDINFTDVTAGAFVLNNLSKSITVYMIDVRHPTYNTKGEWLNAMLNSSGQVVRRFGEDGIPPAPPAGPGIQKAIFADASETNYTFEVFWEVYVGNVRHTGKIDASFPMPASRMVRDFYLFKSEITDPNEDCDFVDADGKRWVVILTDWVHGLRVADPNDTNVNIDNLYIGNLNLDLDGMIRNIINVEPVIQNIFDRNLFEGLIFEFKLPFTVDAFFDAISNANINVTVEPEIISTLYMDQAFIDFMTESQKILKDIANGIDLIVNGINVIARGFENGPLILINETDGMINLRDVVILPTQYTINRLTNNRHTIERDALYTKLSDWSEGGFLSPWAGGNATRPNTSRTLPRGDYVVYYRGMIVEVTVLPHSSSPFAGDGRTNTVVFTESDEVIVIPPTEPRITSISFSVPGNAFFVEATAAQAADPLNLTRPVVHRDLPTGTNSVWLGEALFHGSNLSMAQRQAVVNHSNDLWQNETLPSWLPANTNYGVFHRTGQTNYNLLIGSGINASGSFLGLRPYYQKVNNTNAFIIFRIHPDANNGHEIWLQINFP